VDTFLLNVLACLLSLILNRGNLGSGRGRILSFRAYLARLYIPFSNSATLYTPSRKYRVFALVIALSLSFLIRRQASSISALRSFRKLLVAASTRRVVRAYSRF